MATKKKENKSKETKKVDLEKLETNHRWMIILSIVQILILLFLVFSISSGSNESSKIDSIDEKMTKLDSFFSENVPGYGSTTTGSGDDSKNIVEVSEDDDPWLGSEDAKVTIIEFSDFQCPYCRKYWTETYGKLKEDYIDTGKVKYVFRDFPLEFHPGAIPAAIAGNCVREQKGNDGYFKFHDIAFGEQNKQGVNTIRFTQEDIDSWVEKVGGIDMTAYEACKNDPKQLEEVQKDFKDGQAAGVQGTPSFFINGELLVGALPYSEIKKKIEEALNN